MHFDAVTHTVWGFWLGLVCAPEARDHSWQAGAIKIPATLAPPSVSLRLFVFRPLSTGSPTARDSKLKVTQLTTALMRQEERLTRYMYRTFTWLEYFQFTSHYSSTPPYLTFKYCCFFFLFFFKTQNIKHNLLLLTGKKYDAQLQIKLPNTTYNSYNEPTHQLQHSMILTH